MTAPVLVVRGIARGATTDVATDVATGVAGQAVPRRRRPRGRAVVGGAVALLLVVEAVLVAPQLGGALEALARADVLWLGVAVVAAAASMSMFARTRRRLLRAAGVRVPVAGSVAALYAANAMHATLPGGAAFSTAYTFRWMRSRGASGPVATWVLVAGGLVSTAALVGLGMLGSLLAGGQAGAVELVLSIAGVVGVAVGVRWLGHSPDRIVAAGRWVLRRVNQVRRRPADTGTGAVEELVAQLRSVQPGGRDWIVASTFALLNWVFDVLCLAACASALGVHGLTLPLLLVTYTAGMATSGLSLVPGGIGVVDAALVLTLVAGGIPAASALPAVVLYRLISLVGVVGVGWAVWAVQQFRQGRAPQT